MHIMESDTGRAAPHHDHARDVGRFDRWSARYDRSLFQPLFFRRVHAQVLAALGVEPGERILDVGCGTGVLAARIQALGATVTGVDPAPGMISQARRSRRTRGHLEFHVAAAENLPFPDAAFDAVVSAASMHHWSDPARGLREVSRVLRPVGRLVLADVGSLGAGGDLLRRLRRIDPHHHHGWNLQELAGLLDGADLVKAEAKIVRILGSRIVVARAARYPG